MPKPATTIVLPDVLQQFVKLRVRKGKNASVEEVTLVALDEMRLREALEEGIADLDAGRYEESSPEEFMAQVVADLGLVP
jgi:hypothetical protein